jgi:hypothetical protein
VPAPPFLGSHVLNGIPAGPNAAKAANAACAATSTLPPGHRRGYLKWTGAAWRAHTRERRTAGLIDRLKLSGTK